MVEEQACRGNRFFGCCSYLEYTSSESHLFPMGIAHSRFLKSHSGFDQNGPRDTLHSCFLPFCPGSTRWDNPRKRPRDGCRTCPIRIPCNPLLRNPRRCDPVPSPRGTPRNRCRLFGPERTRAGSFCSLLCDCHQTCRVHTCHNLLVWDWRCHHLAPSPLDIARRVYRNRSWRRNTRARIACMV